MRRTRDLLSTCIDELFSGKSMDQQCNQVFLFACSATSTRDEKHKQEMTEMLLNAKGIGI